MSRYPWSRLWSKDLLSDRKLARAARDCRIPLAMVRGVWLTLMAMANDSPERGALLIAEGIPVLDSEIREDLGIDASTYEAIMDCFEATRMIERGDVIRLCNWDKRNPPSDSSTDRVKRYRAKQRNVTETLQERSSNVIESDPDPDPDLESEGDHNTPPGAGGSLVAVLVNEHYPELEIDDQQAAGLGLLLDSGSADPCDLSAALGWARLKQIVDPVRIGTAAMGWDHKSKGNGSGARGPPSTYGASPGRPPENQAFLDQLLAGTG